MKIGESVLTNVGFAVQQSEAKRFLNNERGKKGIGEVGMLIILLVRYVRLGLLVGLARNTLSGFCQRDAAIICE